MSKTPPRISAIVPIFGFSSDLPRLIDGLRKQTLPPFEIIVVDSNPRPLEHPPSGVVYVRNPEDRGLGWDLNFGAKHARGDYLLHVQQDCLPESESAIERMFEALTPGRVAVAATVSLPEEIWRDYNFWGKALMARWIGDVRQGISDKFDLIRKESFDRIGGYDSDRFSAGGQDMDLYMRLSKEGEIWISPVRILHLHNQSRKTSWKEVITKQYQLAESFGALFRKWRFDLGRAPYARNWTHHINKFGYLLLAALPFAPVATVAALFVISNLANLAAFRIRSLKTPLLLLINPVVFFAGLAGTVRGLFSGKQQFSQDR